MLTHLKIIWGLEAGTAAVTVTVATSAATTATAAVSAATAVAVAATSTASSAVAALGATTTDEQDYDDDNPKTAAKTTISTIHKKTPRIKFSTRGLISLLDRPYYVVGWMSVTAKRKFSFYVRKGEFRYHGKKIRSTRRSLCGNRQGV